MPSIAAGSVQANIAVSSSGDSHAPSRAFSVAGPTRSVLIANGACVRPEPRRGMKDQYLVTTTSSTCWAIHSGSRYWP